MSVLNIGRFVPDLTAAGHLDQALNLGDVTLDLIDDVVYSLRNLARGQVVQCFDTVSDGVVRTLVSRHAIDVLTGNGNRPIV